ncbi:peptide chain release factor N(5)-glutamine methyltransferase [Murimonas intestini]|uniref:peptide chain release factor N(5)-glutamine methyltransferase n=1 Tax=Murimonas intestini TaxID=1337051 RepID=UPI0011DCB73B|nr:peptide chain release factor N(5)-glutamine methyltransferase [Murimonas intestini]
MTYQEALKKAEEYLVSRGIDNAPVDAWYLMEYSCKCDRSWFLMNREKEMPGPSYARYQSMLSDRARHIPLQHLTGEQEFMGIPFMVNENVLIPRQDTEILVEEALKVIKPGSHVLDMCTGSGCIIISLMKYKQDILGTAVDISNAALDVAKENAARQGVCIDFIQGNLFQNIDGKYDAIVSNPPYIPTDEISKLMEEVRCHEPAGALDGREDGLYFYRQIITKSCGFLKDGGWLLFEIGYDQGLSVSEMMKSAGFSDVRVIKDLAGLDRVVKGKLP